jgi:glycosyltransferase involved in cell wall biosynthesis
MKILIINHYAGSAKLGMEYRPYYFATNWLKKGHSVTIIAASYSHVRAHQPRLKKHFHEEYIDGIRYIWIKTPSYKGQSFRRILNMFVFISKLYFKADYLSKLLQPDVVIASSTYPLDIIPAEKIAKRTKAKLIFEVHDLWPLSPIELGGYNKYHPFILIMQWAENFAYRNCDNLVTMLPKTLDYMVLHGLRPEKFHYIPNGINMIDWENREAIPKELELLITGLKSKGHKIIGYTGAHGIANALDSLIESANLMKSEKVTFLLVGSGPEKGKLKRKAAFLHLPNLFFLDPIPKKSIPAFLEKMDILYIGLQKQPLFRFGISPNKLIDYMMAGKPVIQAIESGNDIVTDAKCGISIEPENPGEIKRAILDILKLSDQEKKDIAKNAVDYILKNHEYSILANNFLQII